MDKPGQGNAGDDHNQGGGARAVNQQGIGRTKTEILKDIEQMNKFGTKTQPNIAPLPPPFQPQSAAMTQPMRPTRMIVPPGNNPMMPHPHHGAPQQPPQQTSYQSNWFNAFAQTLTQEQKSMISAMNPDDKRNYLMTMRRKYEQQQQQRMMAVQQQQQQQQQHPMQNMPQYRHHLATRQMVNPAAMGMNHVRTL